MPLAGSTLSVMSSSSTQFFEFLGGIAQSATERQTVRVSPAFVQPIAADDVAAALADVVLGAPANGIVEVAGSRRARRAPVKSSRSRFLGGTSPPASRACLPGKD